MARITAHFVSIGLTALALGACATPPLSEPTARASTFSTQLEWGEVVLGPGDVVRIGVFAHPELSTPYSQNPSGTRVDPEGNVALPLVGAVRIAGLSVGDARNAVAAALATYVKEPKVDVSVVEWSARRVYVLGEVARAGSFVLDRPLRALDALALAGGLNGKARHDEVVLLRGTPEALEVHVFDASTPDARAFVALRDGDVVFARRSGAGRFSDEALPILQGIGSALSSIATLILIDDQLDG